MARLNAALPNKPSDLILLALTDLNRVERLKGYMIDMDTWHDPESGEFSDKCSVCMAGVVMANTLGVPIDEVAAPGNFTNATSRKLSALDELRDGRVGDGFDIMRLNERKGRRFDREITQYSENARRFKLDMRKLAKDLAKAGS